MNSFSSKMTKITLVLLTFLTLQGCVTALVIGTVGAAMIANDRRTTAAQLEDEGIEIKANQLIAADPQIDKHTNLSIISYNRTLLAIGQAPNEMLRDKAIKLLKQIPNVTRLHNQIRIGNPSKISTRTHDSWLTTKIKTAMASDNSFPYSHIKIVTENSEVFLLGLVSEVEANKATEIARNIDGVTKVTKVFEYQ